MKYILTLSFASLLLLGTACSRKTDNAQAEAVPEIEVSVPTVDSLTLYKSFPAYLLSGDLADVVGRVNGTLLKKHYSTGDHVVKGQVLFTIDPTIYRNQVMQAQAQLNTALAKHEFASKQYEAYNKALKMNAVSQMEVIQSQSDMEQAAAAIMQARAQLNDANDNLAHCTVRAPISGIVTAAEYGEGYYINGQGAPVKLCNIYDNSDLTCQMSISDPEYERLLSRNNFNAEVYRNVPLSFDAPMKHSFTADFTYQAPTIDRSTGTLIMQGKVINIDDELKDGMYVKVNLPYGMDSHAVLVKDAAISTDQLGKYLYTVNDSDRVVYSPVEVGEIYRDSLRIITKGIKPGERYVTKALLKVRPGMKINPKQSGK